MTRKTTHSPFTHFLFVVFILTACSSNRSVQKVDDTIDSLVRAKVSQPYTTTYNANRSHALVIEQHATDHVERIMNYAVVDIRSKQVVHEGTFKHGGVKWKDDSTLEVTTFSSVTDEVGTKKIVNITNLQ